MPGRSRQRFLQSVPEFQYQAINASGEAATGSLTAPSRSAAFKSLENQGLTPVRVLEGTGGFKAGKLMRGRLGGASATAAAGSQPLAKLKRTQLILFTEELADLLDAGLPLEQALKVLEERQQSPLIRKVSARIRSEIREGASLSQALHKVAPNSFDELYRSLIAAGEASGSLGTLARRQAANLTVMQELQAKVVQAMIYPSFMIGACIALMVVFMTVLVPQLTDLLGNTGQGLPLATQVLVSVSDMFLASWWAIALVAVMLIIGLRAYVATPKGRLAWHRLQLRIPLAGPVLSTRLYAQLCHGLGNLTANGVPLLNSLKLMGKATSNIYLRRHLDHAAVMVGEGSSLSGSLRKTAAFPDLMTDLIAVGEQTGHLSKSLQKAATRYDKELDGRIKRLTAMITPIIIVFMALIVSVVAYSIVSAIFQSVGGLRNRL